jgi:hypothetical protein
VKGSEKIQINKPRFNIFLDKLTKASVEYFMVSPFLQGAWGKIFILGRNVPREPRLMAGRGAQYDANFPSGKPRPVGGELHVAHISRKFPSDPRLFFLKTKKYFRSHPCGFLTRIYLFYENWSIEI